MMYSKKILLAPAVLLWVVLLAAGPAQSAMNMHQQQVRQQPNQQPPGPNQPPGLRPLPPQQRQMPQVMVNGQLVPGQQQVPSGIINFRQQPMPPMGPFNQTGPMHPVNQTAGQRSLFTDFSLFGGSEKLPNLNLKGGDEYDGDEEDPKSKLKQEIDKLGLKGKGKFEKLESELKKGFQKLKLEKDEKFKEKLGEKLGKGKGKGKMDDGYGYDEDEGYGSGGGYGGDYKSKTKEGYGDDYKPKAKEGYGDDYKSKAKEGYGDDYKPKAKEGYGDDYKSKAKEYDDGYDGDDYGGKKKPGHKQKMKGGGKGYKEDDDYKSKGYGKEEYDKEDDYGKGGYKSAPKEDKKYYESDDYAPAESNYNKTYQSAYPASAYPGHYQVDPNPKGKYIPQYRSRPPMPPMMVQTRGSAMNQQYQQYQQQPSTYQPKQQASSSYSQPSSQQSYQKQPEQQQYQQQYQQPQQQQYQQPQSSYSQPQSSYSQPQASYEGQQPYAQAESSSYRGQQPQKAQYSASSSTYAQAPSTEYVDSDEYERSKYKMYTTKVYQTSPVLEVETYDGGSADTYGYGANSYNYAGGYGGGGYGGSGGYGGAGYGSGGYGGGGYGGSGGYGSGGYGGGGYGGSGGYGGGGYGGSGGYGGGGYGGSGGGYSGAYPIGGGYQQVPYKATYTAPAYYGRPAYYHHTTPTVYQNATKSDHMPVAVANLYCSGSANPCSCTLYLTEINKHNMLVSGVCSGLAKNKFYALHIYEYGDITSGCTSIGGHYNPQNYTHGYINGPGGHLGDLGNVKTDNNGVAFVNKLKRGQISVLCDYGGYSILGHSLGLSDSKDDLGLGGNVKSLKNGNSGKVIACGVIGLANKDNSYETRELKDKIAAAEAEEQQTGSESK